MKYVNYAKTMKQYRNWYRLPIIDELFGQHANLYRSFLAATSQNTSVRNNVLLANKAYKQFQNAEPFTGYLPTVIDNLNRILDGAPCSGPKISAFERALLGDSEAIVVDLHITELFFNRKFPTIRQRREIIKHVNKTATKLQWEPRQTQAALWAYNFKRRGADSVPSYTQFLGKI